ncbi:tryptophan 2,3-dioxygenase [Bhargavaea cecembensis]|uniref:tryptophan 2,3-dioxygenase n=1 Tax=Bhargavaea cecembensis TaxID=394098 RepID=UPI00058D6557|nr:tryptophan 2,3-dioxygenase [Bhargavaea cecembensis]
MPKKISELKESLQGEKSIHTDFRESMTYGEYLSLDQILSSQNRLSGHHDEMLFIIIHQVSELWMKLLLHELTAAIDDINAGELQSAFKKLARVSKIQSQIIGAWDVLSTMTPAEYLEFRGSLGKASGFQSHQYRLIEFALGYKSEFILKIYEKDADIRRELEQAYRAPGIYDAAIGALSRAGFAINPDLLDRDFRIVYDGDPSVAAAWEEVYRDTDRYWDLYQLAEKLVDVEDWLQQWRFRHMKTVERIIGFRQGTGGSSGVAYLRNVLDHRFFPELWNLRTTL